MNPTDFSPSGADRLDLLQTFARIVDAGSMSAAARALGTTQPTVSRRLRQLEDLLGRRLIHRSTHSLRLSDDGERAYRHAKELLAGWSRFAEELQGEEAEPEGFLRILAPHAFGQEVLMGPLEAFLQRYPKVSVEWLLMDNRPNFIADGVDCAIQVGEVRDPQHVAIRLGEVPRYVVAAPSLLAGEAPPEDPADLSRWPWLALRPYYLKDITLVHTAHSERTRVGVRARLTTDNLYALRSAVLRGLGIGVVSAWIMQDDLAAGRLVRLVSPWEAEPIPIHLIYPYAAHYTPALRHFVRSMRNLTTEAFGATLKKTSPVG